MEVIEKRKKPEASGERSGPPSPPTPEDPGHTAVAILTGGGDKPYALGLANALIERGVAFEFIGSDDLDVPEVRESRFVRFLNLRGDQEPGVAVLRKVRRLLAYYCRLIGWAATSRSPVFHLLWNNKFEVFDRTFLILYYRLLGKRLALTVHNVNIGKRDGNDTWWNRWTLGFQYRLTHHLFVHTGGMKAELERDFGIPGGRISVIPFGINNSVPETDLTSGAARTRLGLGPDHKVILFFGNIAPYKGLEYLVEALRTLAARDSAYRLIVAGRPKGNESYWAEIEENIDRWGLQGNVIKRIEYVPDEETEIYFKAADVFALPYTHIFQSGVLFLGYNFGLPVIASDVGSLGEDIVEGKTGIVCRPADPDDLGRALQCYFSGDLYRELESRRKDIRDYAHEAHSWEKVSRISGEVYAALT